jgi:hypothetical protein
MGGMDIIRQLAHNPPQASPLYGVRWILATGSSKKEGYCRMMTCKAIDEYVMGKRLMKMRKKEYWLVEPGVLMSGGKMILYHGTPKLNVAEGIVKDGFRASKSGNFGAGVYFTRNIAFCQKFGNYLVLAEVELGRLKEAETKDPSGSWQKDYDSIWISKEKSWRKEEEWCIKDPQSIKARELLKST